MSFDDRSLYTVLIYLDECAVGGETQLIQGRGEQSNCTIADGKKVRRQALERPSVQG